MPIVRADIEATLSRVDADTLRLVLESAGVSPRGAESSRELAERIADALWWHYTSPLGYLADQTTLEDIVAYVARKVGVNGAVDANLDGWAQLAQLTKAMFRTLPESGVSLLDLDEVTRSKIEPSWMPTVGFGVGSGTSIGTGMASGKVLGWLRGPLGRLIPLIPPLAPYYKLLVGGLGAVRLVAWPLGVAFAVLSVNSALGANERKLVPLLLGVGALGPDPVREADIITLDAGGDLPDPQPL
ncbi:MAG: hypothetical protein H6737_29315 [Alphaproteobacteria bacterium]|nr:hypothetical protein [Alphaproteobacteria bacterium]